MHVHFIAVPRGESVKGAMRTLIAEAAEAEYVRTVFVINRDGTLFGAIDLKSLIVARENDDLESLSRSELPFVYDTDTVSAHREVSGDGLIPVLSHTDQRLIGVLTATELTMLGKELLDEDYAMLAAISGEEKPNAALAGSIRLRAPWLAVLLLMGLAVSLAVSRFERIVESLPVLVAYQSLILGMAGNVGTQSLAVTVRALGESRLHTNARRAVLRETVIALGCGILIGTAAFLTVLLTLAVTLPGSLGFLCAIAGCVALAMCLAMTVSGFTGAVIPILLSFLGIDPAVASGPLITTVNDLVAVLGYYGLSALMLHTIL